MASADISVVVERCVHDTLRDVVQRISDQHGIRVDAFTVRWMNASTAGEEKYLVVGVEAHTATGH